MYDFNIYTSLKGKFLISSPSILDQRFNKAVIYICSHDQEGAMGIVVNKPSRDIKFIEIISELEGDSKITNDNGDIKIHYGGPVDLDRGFVLHSSDYQNSKKKQNINNNIILSSNKKILSDIASGKGPKKSLIAIGYAGWEHGQLEKEIKSNAWIELDADEDILFSLDNSNKWLECIKKIGFNTSDHFSAYFSSLSGTA